MPKMKQPKVMKVERFVLSKPYRAMAWELNLAYDEVKKKGHYSNNIKLFEQTLENFYNKYNRKPANKHHISMQIQMTEEQINELGDIVDQFVNIAVEERNFYYDDLTKGFSPEDKVKIKEKLEKPEKTEEKEIETPWKVFDVDKFKQIQELYGVKTVQEFIDWTDEMERYRTSIFLQTILTSDQIADIFAYSGNKDDKSSYKKIEKMIQNQYNKNGLIGDELRQAVMKRIKINEKQRLKRKKR